MRAVIARQVSVLVLGVLTVAIVGCGSGMGTPTTVKGKLTVDGKPAADHTVTFHNSNGEVQAEHRTFQAKTNSSGDYEITTIYPGEYDVMVLAPISDDPSKATAALSVTLIPTAGGTSLKATVTAEPTTFNCEMKKAS